VLTCPAKEFGRMASDPMALARGALELWEERKKKEGLLNDPDCRNIFAIKK
jgi:hypothetical protein